MNILPRNDDYEEIIEDVIEVILDLLFKDKI